MPRARIRRHLRVIEGRKPPRRPRLAWKWLIAGVGIGLFALAVLLVRDRLDRPTEDLFTLASGTLEITHETKALVIRQESIHTTPIAGEFRPLAPEGNRVRVGAAVAEIAPGSARSSGRQVPVQARSTAGSTGDDRAEELRDELQELSRQLYRTAVQLQQAQSTEDMAAVGRLQKQMEELSEREQVVAAALTALEHGETPYVPAPPPVSVPDAAPTEATVLYAEAAGIVVYSLDGLEQIAAPGDLERLTPGIVEGLQTTKRSVDEGPVAAGQAVFKVIDNAVMHLAVVLPQAKAQGLTAGGQVAVRLREYGDRLLPMTIERVTTEGERTLLVLAPAGFPDELMTVRRPTVSMVLSRHTGLIAPISAVEWSGPKPGIYVQEGRSTKLYPIRVIAQNETHVAFAADLREGAQILTTARKNR